MKGILLVGGRGSRLQPITNTICKQLLLVYNKPMFYYPLYTLIQAGIDDVLLIGTPEDLPHFRTLLGTGAQLGMRIQYAQQPIPLGIADALRIAGRFFSRERLALILGDNLFLGDFTAQLVSAALSDQAVIFLKKVEDPTGFGVAKLEQNQVVGLWEKPAQPQSDFAVTGLYFYPPDCTDIACALQPSARGELEITDVNKAFLAQNRLCAHVLPDAVQWVDTGTYAGLHYGSNLVYAAQQQGQCYGCIEMAAYEKSLISKERLRTLASEMTQSEYAALLERNT